MAVNLPTPTSDQVASATRSLVTALVSWAIGAGYISPDMGPNIILAAVPIALIAWGIWSKRASAVAASAATQPDVSLVVDTQKKADAIIKADPSVADSVSVAK